LEQGTDAPIHAARRRRLLVTVLVALSCGFGIWRFVPAIDQTPRHMDETLWIGSGLYVIGLLEHGDFDRDRWFCKGCGYGGDLNQQLGRLVVALPVSVRPNGWDKRIDLRPWRREPPRPLLTRARAASAAVAAVGLALIFGLAYQTAGLWPGLLAALLVAANHLYLLYATRAMPDIHYCLLLVGAALIGAVLVSQGPPVPDSDRGAWKRNIPIRMVIAGGVLVGMATSIKVTGLVVGGPTLLGAVLYRGLALGARLREMVWSALMLAAAIAVTILLLNPLYWPEPHKIEMPALAAEVGTLPHVIASGGVRSICHRDRPQIANLCRLIAFPTMYPRWKEQLARYKPKNEDWYFSRRPYAAIHTALLRTFATVPGEWIFLPIGLAFCVKRALEGVRRGRGDPAVVAAFFFAANYALLILFLPLDWDRYYLTLVVAGKVVIAIGVCRTGSAVRSLLAPRRLRQWSTAGAGARAGLAGES
jgi:hypothetical protein